jgi:hypothetical protein
MGRHVEISGFVPEIVPGAQDISASPNGAGVPVSAATLARLGIRTVTAVFGTFGASGAGVLQVGLTPRTQPLPWSGKIIRWTLEADQIGNLVIDIWRLTYNSYPPVLANSICSTANIPTLASQIRTEGTNLPVMLNARDVLVFNVKSVATITAAVLGLWVQT